MHFAVLDLQQLAMQRRLRAFSSLVFPGHNLSVFPDQPWMCLQ